MSDLKCSVNPYYSSIVCSTLLELSFFMMMIVIFYDGLLTALLTNSKQTNHCNIM